MPYFPPWYSPYSYTHAIVAFMSLRPWFGDRIVTHGRSGGSRSHPGEVHCSDMAQRKPLWYSTSMLQWPFTLIVWQTSSFWSELSFPSEPPTCSPSFHLCLDNLRMFVNTRHQPQCNRSSNRFRNLSLVHRPETSGVGMSDAAHIRHVLRHDREILVQAQRIDGQCIKCIGRWSVSPSPFASLCTTQVVRRKDIAHFPLPGHLPRQIIIFLLLKPFPFEALE